MVVRYYLKNKKFENKFDVRFNQNRQILGNKINSI